MTYEIIRAAAPAPALTGGNVKSDERLTMEQLEVGDAFMVGSEAASRRAHYARYELGAKRFTVRKVPSKGWQVRRTV